MAVLRQPQPAFAASSAVAASSLASRFRGAPVCRARAANAAPRRPRAAAPVRMRGAYNPDEQRFAIGFTYFAEKLNGRAAMIGFVVAFSFELLWPEQGGLVSVFLNLIGKGSA